MTPDLIARRYYDLFNERRLDEAEQLIDPHAIFHYVPTKQHLIGRAGYRALAAAWLNAFEDARLEVRSITVTGGGILAVEFIGHGTLTGDLVLGDSLVIAPTGRSAELTFHDRLVITDGLIAESQLDFDVVEMKKRLGA